MERNKAITIMVISFILIATVMCVGALLLKRNRDSNKPKLVFPTRTSTPFISQGQQPLVTVTLEPITVGVAEVATPFPTLSLDTPKPTVFCHSKYADKVGNPHNTRLPYKPRKGDIYMCDSRGNWIPIR